MTERQVELHRKWASIIASYRSSGQTKTEFCKTAGITPRQLWYWMKKEEANELAGSEPTKWIPMEVGDDILIQDLDVIQIKVGVAKVEVKPGFNQKHLLDVLTVLRSLC